MGGCRCTFRDCSNTSSSQPRMHFFHFPFRNKERCEEWAKHSNNMRFLKLPVSQLRNKVVCEEHFRDPCFMNYRKDRLTKFAVPTILRISSGEILDFDVPVTEKKNHLPATEDAKFSSASNTSVILTASPTTTSSIVPAPPSTGRKLHNSMASTPCYNIDVDNGFIINAATLECPKPPKLLNSLVGQPKKNINQLKRPSNGDPLILTKISIKKKPKLPQVAPILSKPKVEKEHNVNFVVDDDFDETHAAETIECIENNVAQSDISESKEEQQQQELEMIRQEHAMEMDELKRRLAQKETKVAELEAFVQQQQSEMEQTQNQLELQLKENGRLLHINVEQRLQIDQKELQIKRLEQKHAEQLKSVELKSEAVHSAPQLALQPIVMTATTLLPKLKQDRTPLTKPQLFNGVRRYLNPSMVALLRMELFGDPEREYRPDEQEFSMELLSQSVDAEVNLYDYMRSEWRFRLPPKNVVEQWIRKRRETDGCDNVDWDDC